jgi:general secretion pathway protein M
MNAWTSRLATWRTRWRALPPREQRALALAAAVLALFLLWLFALQPAWRTVREAPGQIDRLDTQLQAMRRLAAESRELRGAPAISATESAQALRAATDRLDGAGRLSTAGDRATLTLINASGEQIQRWLLEARNGARARPIEANLVRSGEGYSGSLSVAIGGATP